MWFSDRDLQWSRIWGWGLRQSVVVWWWCSRQSEHRLAVGWCGQRRSGSILPASVRRVSRPRRSAVARWELRSWRRQLWQHQLRYTPYYIQLSANCRFVLSIFVFINFNFPSVFHCLLLINFICPSRGGTNTKTEKQPKLNQASLIIR